MSSILVINAAGPETRVALVENGTISEFYLERKKDKGIVGNIYKGKVVRVLPGMQAAFVDIGLEKAAFLYVADVAGGPDFSEEFDLSETPEGEHADGPTGDVPPDDAADRTVNDAASVDGQPDADAVEADAGEGEGDEVAEEGEAAEAAPGEPSSEAVAAESAPSNAAAKKADAKSLEPLARKKKRSGPVDRKAAEISKAGRSAQIQDLLKEGQEVIVQVVKDPIGTKGARVTCHISLPGRHLVFMPTVDHVGISRRIDAEKERRRLRELVDGLRPPGTGFIVRTVADGVSKEKLVADIKFLLGIWNEMAHKKDRLRAPALLHPDLDLILRSIRDLFSAEVEKLVIDDQGEYERIVQFVEQAVPNLKSAIELYAGNEPIFDAYGIEAELSRALSRKVWLKSGGYLVIDQAEALTAIDINSGRFVGKKNLEETITQINCEAAKEIVYQLRLRNIGGIIIIDFIDMEKQPNREKVFKALQDALQKDRAKTNIVKISELGLVEMTRKRVRESVGRLLHEACPDCDGRGHIKSKATIAYEIFRDVQREGTSRREDTLFISCNPEVAKYIQTDEREALRHLMMRYNKRVEIKPQPAYHQEQYEVVARWSKSGEQGAKKGEKPEKGERPEKPEKAPSPQQQGRPAPQGRQGQLPLAPQPAAVDQQPPATAEAAEEEGDEGDEGEEETPAAGTAQQPGQPGQPGQGRKRRRRRRGRGGGGGQGAQGQQGGEKPVPAPAPAERSSS